MAAGLAGNTIENIDRIILKYRLPESALPMEQIGIYQANIKIAILMVLFIQMFRYAAEPFFFNNSKEKDSRETIALVMKYFVVFCLLIFLGVTFYLDLIQHIIGEKFRDGLDIVPILLLAFMCLGIYYNLTIWFKLSNQTKYGLLIASIGAVISIAGNWLLIPVWGYHASAWIHLTCYAVMIAITWQLGRKHYPVPYPLKRIALYVVIALALYTVGYFTKVENLSINLLKNTILFITFAFYINKKENLLKQIFG